MEDEYPGSTSVRQPLGRRLLRLVHVEGMPAVGTRLYDAVSRTAIFQRHYRAVARDVLASDADITSVLDVGSGPGWLLVAFQRERPGVRLAGVDISPSMVERARRNVARAGLAEVVELRAGDAARLPFEDGSFDVVVSTGSLHHWRDPAAGLREIHRVLRAGRRAFVYDIVADTPREVLRSSAEEFGRLRTVLLWVHAFEEPFYNQEQLASLASASPFGGGRVGFLGVLCRVEMAKGKRAPSAAPA